MRARTTATLAALTIVTLTGSAPAVTPAGLVPLSPARGGVWRRRAGARAAAGRAGQTRGRI
ncbi:hypothetical protein ACFRAR_30380, partial [Kitasatospora sp. NPDC056651]|uniref:hypothetical protein n=1 Tax=Kitasatospora sp. NPDC056651 TaxID=3345892 RepID=UPI0036969554